jgi:hypothetical protein
MAKIEQIPSHLRWEIAAKSATALPVLYDIIFRKALGGRYDATMLPIWVEGGREVKMIADALGLPKENAKDIGETYGLIAKILFGPEMKSSVSKRRADRAAMKGTRCPLLNRALEMGMDPALLLNACQAFNRSAVENLNPKYTVRSAKSMCTGDRYCENVIEPKK